MSSLEPKVPGRAVGATRGRPTRAVALAVVVAVAALVVRALPALGVTAHYTLLNELEATGSGVGCVDVAWAAGQGLVDPVEVRWLAENGVGCPDGTVEREAVQSEQYVVMAALAARGQLSCADVEWNAHYGYLSSTGLANLRGIVPGCTVSTYASLVALMASGRLACADVYWHYFNATIDKGEAYWLVQGLGCDWHVIEPPVAPGQRTVTYEIAVRGTPAADVAEFVRSADATLNDPRGWSRAGITFVVAPAGGGSFTLWLAEAATLPEFGYPCNAQWSCRSGRDVVINDVRWREASPAWNSAGGALRDYQHLVVNHEVGHWLGIGHHDCGGTGQPAPVMQQQSIDLQGCTFNPWPLDWELALVA